MNATHVIRWLIAIGLFTGVAPDSRAQEFVFTDLDFPNAFSTWAMGLNDAKEVVGFYFGADSVRHGFVYNGNSYITFDYPGAVRTDAYGINNAGTVVGWYDDSSGVRRGFIKDGTTYTTLDPPNASSTRPHDINDAGTIVGTFADNTGTSFVYDGSNYTTLAYPGAAFTVAYGINNAGTVVGWYYDGSDGHGFIYDGSYTTLDVPSTPDRFVRSSIAYGINDAGIVVGKYEDLYLVTRGFLYDGVTFIGVEPPGVGQGTRINNEVTGINNNGDLSGWYEPGQFASGYVRSATQVFDDVPTNYWAFSFIERLADSGITAGCGNANFCPEAAVTRAQMAVFLERGMNGSSFSPPVATGNVFLDVGAGDFAASFIEQLFLDGITAGCGSNIYCPDIDVTRAQMAVFLLRAKYGAGYVPSPQVCVLIYPPVCGFSDVDSSHSSAVWIEQLAAEGITVGCGNGKFCPEAPVTRAQMAVFLVRTFGL